MSYKRHATSPVLQKENNTQSNAYADTFVDEKIGNSMKVGSKESYFSSNDDR